MKHDISTFAANLLHHARSGKHARIGGIFTPEELTAAAIALQAFPVLASALQDIANYDDRAVIENDAGEALRRMARVAIAKAF